MAICTTTSLQVFTVHLQMYLFYTHKKTTVSYVCFSKMLIIYDQFIYTFCTEKNPNRKKTVENSGRVFIYVLKLGAVFIGPLVMGSYFCNEFAIICQKMSN